MKAGTVQTIAVALGFLLLYIALITAVRAVNRVLLEILEVSRVNKIIWLGCVSACRYFCDNVVYSVGFRIDSKTSKNKEKNNS